MEEGAEAAAVCALNALAVLEVALGSLDRVERVLTVTGYVASTPDFHRQPDVVDGASAVLHQVFGEAGRHTRSAVGVAALPRGGAVEIEVTVAVRPVAGPDEGQETTMTGADRVAELADAGGRHPRASRGPGPCRRGSDRCGRGRRWRPRPTRSAARPGTTWPSTWPSPGPRRLGAGGRRGRRARPGLLGRGPDHRRPGPGAGRPGHRRRGARRGRPGAPGVPGVLGTGWPSPAPPRSLRGTVGLPATVAGVPVAAGRLGGRRRRRRGGGARRPPGVGAGGRPGPGGGRGRLLRGAARRGDHRRAPGPRRLAGRRSGDRRTDPGRPVRRQWLV